MVKFLIESGADPNVIDNAGETVLHEIGFKGNFLIFIFVIIDLIWGKSLK